MSFTDCLNSQFLNASHEISDIFYSGQFSEIFVFRKLVLCLEISDILIGQPIKVLTGHQFSLVT